MLSLFVFFFSNDEVEEGDPGSDSDFEIEAKKEVSSNSPYCNRSVNSGYIQTRPQSFEFAIAKQIRNNVDALSFSLEVKEFIK